MVRLLASVFTAAAVGLILARLAGHRIALRRRVRPVKERPTDLDVTAVQFWAVSVGAGAVTFLLVLGLTGLIVVAVMPALLVATLPRAYFSRQRSTRIAEIQQAWPDGLRDLVSSVRSGSSLLTAIESLARYGPQPLRAAFGDFPTYARSLGVVPALEMIKSDLAHPTSDRVIEVLILAHSKGGAVVPQILSDLASATTRDTWTLEQIRTEALEQKINSRVVFVLPWLVLVAMTTQSPAFREFYSSPGGVVVVLIGAAMSAVGMMVAARLGRDPVEPRVLIRGDQ